MEVTDRQYASNLAPTDSRWRQRAHELEHDGVRPTHEDEIFKSDSLREVQRKKFDNRLAKENHAHAEKIAAQQLNVAARSVWITSSAIYLRCSCRQSPPSRLSS